jgi:hypothetical protein
MLTEVSQVSCSHQPACPACDDHDAAAAVIVVDHCEQGWYQLCNGVILFEDGECIGTTQASDNAPRAA